MNLGKVKFDDNEHLKYRAYINGVMIMEENDFELFLDRCRRAYKFSKRHRKCLGCNGTGKVLSPISGE